MGVVRDIKREIEQLMRYAARESRSRDGNRMRGELYADAGKLRQQARMLERNTIKYVDAPVALGEWHTFRVDFQDETIRVSLNGKTYIDLKSDKIAGAGKAGVWTKADSVTLFDDFVVEGKVSR